MWLTHVDARDEEAVASTDEKGMLLVVIMTAMTRSLPVDVLHAECRWRPCGYP